MESLPMRGRILLVDGDTSVQATLVNFLSGIGEGEGAPERVAEIMEIFG